ncbi:MAG: hypothetical protein ACW981_09565 [Candidatus Hodarchaeales archaeon]|jgi:uncharacterized membrane protein
MNLEIRDNHLSFSILVVISVSIHILITLILILIDFPLFQQLSFELLNVLVFFFLIIISRKDINFIGTGFIILTAIMVSLVEINNITIKNNYSYTGFNLWIVNHEPMANLPAGGYPLVIPFGWILCLYASYMLTNFIFKKKNNDQLTIHDVVIRIISDSMITWTYAVFLEATGENLSWWDYAPKVVDQFFGVPIGTLYFYVLFSIFFSTVIRFGIYFGNFKKRKKPRKIVFSKLSWTSIYIPTMFVYSWIFTLILAINKFGTFHWSLVVSVPPLFLYIVIITREYQNNIETGENVDERTKKYMNFTFQIRTIMAYLLLVLFLIFVLEIYTNYIYMLIIIFLILTGGILILREYIINKKKKIMNE